MTKYNLSLSHVDTCLSSYLQDHHTRDGETMVGVYLDGTTTYEQVKQTLIDELNPDCADITDEMIESVVNEEFSTVPDMSKIFDTSLETPDEDDDDTSEPCQAWFVLKWEINTDD